MTRSYLKISLKTSRNSDKIIFKKSEDYLSIALSFLRFDAELCMRRIIRSQKYDLIKLSFYTSGKFPIRAKSVLE